jgi:hypothetical protein
MIEAEARKIFDLKLPLCGTLGLDVREVCIDAGVPVEMVDKFIAADKALTNAMRACTTDPTVLPLAGPLSRDANDAGFSCLSQKVTGLPMIIWVIASGAPEDVPYIRVQTDHSAAPRVTESVCLTVGENPALIAGSGLAEDDTAAAAAFVLRNRKALLDQWKGRGDPSAFVAVLIP